MPPASPHQRLSIDMCGCTWAVERYGNLDELWDQMDQAAFGDDERLPYWCEVWPASLLLGRWLHEHAARIAGRRCLDMGCGLGLTALAASRLGARVVGLDYEWPALRYARRNQRLNLDPAADVQPGWVQMDWRAPGLRPGAFAYVWGGDIMYERRFIEPVARFLAHSLAPGGLVWLAEPNRGLYSEFRAHMLNLGWRCEKMLVERVPPPYAQQTLATVNIWELAAPATPPSTPPSAPSGSTSRDYP